MYFNILFSYFSLRWLIAGLHHRSVNFPPFPSNRYLDDISAEEKHRYENKLQVSGTCNPCTAPVTVFQALKSAKNSARAPLWWCLYIWIPPLRLLPGWKHIEVQTAICIFSMDGSIMLLLVRWKTRNSWLSKWPYKGIKWKLWIASLIQ